MGSLQLNSVARIIQQESPVLFLVFRILNISSLSSNPQRLKALKHAMTKQAGEAIKAVKVDTFCVQKHSEYSRYNVAGENELAEPSPSLPDPTAS